MASTICTLYVALRIDHKLLMDHPERNLGIEGLAYTEGYDEGTRHLETCAAKDAHGKSWDSDQQGDAFYDPNNDEGLPVPEARFIVWDEGVVGVSDPVLNRPSSVVASISLFASRQESITSDDPQGDNRELLRSYKLFQLNPMVETFVNTVTEGDKEMLRQIAMGETSSL
jgi:hypothetical protein